MVRISVLLLALAIALDGAQAQQPGKARVDEQSQTLVWERPKQQGPPPDPYYCLVEPLPTSWGLENPPAEIEQNGFVSGDPGTSSGSFYLRNLGPASVQSLSVVMEYLSKDGAVIDRVPYAAVVKEEQQSFHPPFPVQLVYAWESALLPGESARIQGMKNGVRIAGCPAQARVTVLMIQYSNGAAQDLFMPGWRLGPVPRRKEASVDFPPGVVTAPLALWAKLRISSEGRVQQVVVKDQGHAEGLGELIKEMFMQKWEFHPSLLNGQPTDSELEVFIRFHAARSLSFPAEMDTLAPATLVDFFPDPPFPGRWSVTYGGLSGTSVVPWRF